VGDGAAGIEAPRANLWMVVAIAIVAYAADDMVHEVLGHGLACALTGVPTLSLSSVALQTGSISRFVAAAGSIMNTVVGMLAFFLFRRVRSFGGTRYFLWLFASINLFNGTGYLFFSGLLAIGDWSVVIAGLEPHVVWRALLAVAGAALYVGAVRLSARTMASLVRGGDVDRRDVGRLVFPAYVAGGLLLVGASALNRIDPSLVLTSGVSSGFGAMAGLLTVPRLVEAGAGGGVGAGGTGAGAQPLRFNAGWSIAAALIALVFVAVLGPGVRLS
jgi:hypothetical protein